MSAQGGCVCDTRGGPRRVDPVPDEGRVALVSGGEEGLGPHIVRRLSALGMRVVLGCRSVERGRLVIDDLDELADRVAVRQLDVVDAASVERLASWIAGRLGRCDALVCNLVLGPDGDPDGFDLENARRELWTSLQGTWHLVQAMAPMMRATGYGRVVAMIDDDRAPAPVALTRHRMTRSAVNSLITLMAEEFADDNILANAYCRQLETSGHPLAGAVDTPVWLATLPDDGPTGSLYG